MSKQLDRIALCPVSIDKLRVPTLRKGSRPVVMAAVFASVAVTGGAPRGHLVGAGSIETASRRLRVTGWEQVLHM